jgi:hypothetical protein
LGRAQEGRDVLGGVGRAVGGAAGKLVRGRASGAGNKRAHLTECRLQLLFGGAEATAPHQPPTGRQRRAPHDARGPNVAVNAALVAETVSEAGLAEQFVELDLVRRRYLGANFGRAGIDVRSGLGFSGDGDADGPQQCVRYFDRRRLGDVEAIDQSVADQIEVAGNGRACFAGVGPQLRERPRGVAI